MTDELAHHGIRGMHWGQRSKASSGGSSPRSQFHKPGVRGMFGPHHMAQKVGSYDPEKIKRQRKNVAKLMLGAYATLGVLAAMQHFSENPIKIHIDYTRPPFKKAVEPFFKATVKKVIPKLLPGG